MSKIGIEHATNPFGAPREGEAVHEHQMQKRPACADLLTGAGCEVYSQMFQVLGWSHRMFSRNPPGESEGAFL